MHKPIVLSSEIKEEYFLKYSSLVKNKLEEVLNGREFIEPISNSKFKFIIKLQKDSNAYKWVESLMPEKNLRILLTGEYEEIIRLIKEAEIIEPNFRQVVSKKKHGITKVDKDIEIEDLNQIFKVIFTDEIYSNNTIFDKKWIYKKREYKVCPYCGQNTVELIETDGNELPNYETEHYFPKSEFPYLAININNLFPVCHNCNTSGIGKGTKLPVSEDLKDEYLPYPYHFNKDSFEFKCSLKGAEIYNRDNFSIFIDYKENKNLRKGYNEIIKIEPSYVNKNNEAKQIFNRVQSLNEDYQNLMIDPFNISQERFNKVSFKCLGFEDTEEEARLTPMAKFKVDILKNFLQMAPKIGDGMG